MQVQDFYNSLITNGIDCFCGVPDSLLKSFCAYISDNSTNHTITANEGNAIGLAAGHYLATGNPACVYMQNSGIGNCVNPLLSLTDEDVYNIPLLMIIGWRGEPGKKDEPQHVKQGKVTDKLLDAMGIDYKVLPEDFAQAEPIINGACKYLKNTKKPYALIIKKGLFEEYKLKNKKANPYTLIRENAIENVLKHLNFKDVIVSTTGHISREVYEIREKFKQSHKQDFLTVGSMGHSSSIALGIALSKDNRNIYCFDGDGALLMHLGSIVINASKNLKNFKHIVFNNEAHDSVGAQPTAADSANLPQIAINAGYKNAYSVKNLEELDNILPKFISDNGPSFLEIKVKCGARADLGRPKESPTENKRLFMDNLNQIDFCYCGAINNLSKILKAEKVQKALIFTGKGSYETIKHTIEKELSEIDFEYYNQFSTNPKIEEIDTAIQNIKNNFDIIISIGGGSVIDFAKAFRYYTQYKVPHIAIPTTCGTGSESTQFAVVYKNGVKTSLDNKEILPNYAIVDSQFVVNNPSNLKASTAMDAYCQAIESYWAVKSTSESKEYAKKAILLCKENIEKYVNTQDESAAQNMAKASHFAGKAINISRTTAAHALSYKITSEYKIPHGHAVAYSIAGLWNENKKVTINTLNDPRGIDYVLDTMKNLEELISSNSDTYFKNLFKSINLDCNIHNIKDLDISLIVNSVNIDRLKNNPRKLTSEDCSKILDYKLY